MLHNNEPVKPDAVNVELPQLFTTDTIGATGFVLGAAIPLPASLTHPLTVCVTVYDPAEVTVIDDVVSPVLHNNEPAKPVTVNTELSQLFSIDTIGADGTVFGAAIPMPAGLLHPFIVCVTEYVPGVVTVIEEVVSPVLHNNEPAKPDAANIELPQLSTTDTDGASTAEFNGAATPLPVALVHPSTVCVTVYVPGEVTVMDVFVSPVLHNNDPVKPDAVSVELPQLFITETPGAFGIVLGAAIPLPASLVHPSTVWVTV